MREVIIGVFRQPYAARRALRELCAAGFSEDQIGFLAHEELQSSQPVTQRLASMKAEFGQAESAGAARQGMGLGEALRRAGDGARQRACEMSRIPERVRVLTARMGLRAEEWSSPAAASSWALRAVPRQLSGIGAILAGGLFEKVGNGTADMIPTFIGLGISREEASHYERELARGRTIIVIQDCPNASEVLSILGRNGSFERTLFRLLPTIEQEHQSSIAC